MNLEAIEQRCLAYLKDVQRPLVPVSKLLAHIQEDEECGLVDERELLGFLRLHELFTVVDPLGLAGDAKSARDAEEAGMMTEPAVILSTRLPSQAELAASLEQQMGTMMNALEATMQQARTEDNPKLAMQVQGMLKRARDLQQRLSDEGLTGKQ